jgi:GGDEF-like domain/PucR C-terminal helix-turn-helix domain
MSRSLVAVRLDVVERLRTRRQHALETVVTYLHSAARATAGTHDVQLSLGWHEAASACLDCGLLAIEQGDEWTGPIPPVVVVQERRAARNGIDLSTSIARYTTAYRIAWSYVLEELGYSDISEEHRMLVARQASTASLSLLTRLLTDVADVHLGALKQDSRRSALNDGWLARRILAGEPVDVREINYDFDAEHVGLIAWGKVASKAIATVSDRLRYQSWIISNDDGTVWAWFASSRGCSSDDIAQALDLHPKVSAAIGRPAPELAGFRDTHGLAQAAYRVAKLSGQRLTHYTDVAREARALQDPLHARWLIRSYVTPIITHREGVTLRKTLETYYNAAQNVDKAARLLSSDWHTVRRRLDRVGAIIGSQLPALHSEMELALRLARLYEGANRDIN